MRARRRRQRLGWIGWIAFLRRLREDPIILSSLAMQVVGAGALRSLPAFRKSVDNVEKAGLRRVEAVDNLPGLIVRVNGRC